MMSSLVVYAVVVEVVSRTSATPEPVAGSELVRYIFYAIGVSTVFTVQFLRAMSLRRMEGLSVDAALAKLQTLTVLTGALAETPAVLGLVLVLGWQQYSDFYVLAVISLYVFVRHFPRYGSWQSLERS